MGRVTLGRSPKFSKSKRVSQRKVESCYVNHLMTNCCTSQKLTALLGNIGSILTDAASFLMRLFSVTPNIL